MPNNEATIIKDEETIRQINKSIETINKSFKRKRALIWAKVAAGIIVFTLVFNAFTALTIRGTLACPGQSKSKIYLLLVPTTAPGWDWSVCDLKPDSTTAASIKR